MSNSDVAVPRTESLAREDWLLLILRTKVYPVSLVITPMGFYMGAGNTN